MNVVGFRYPFSGQIKEASQTNFNSEVNNLIIELLTKILLYVIFTRFAKVSIKKKHNKIKTLRRKIASKKREKTETDTTTSTSDFKGRKRKRQGNKNIIETEYIE